MQLHRRHLQRPSRLRVPERHHARPHQEPVRYQEPPEPPRRQRPPSLHPFHPPRRRKRDPPNPLRVPLPQRDRAPPEPPPGIQGGATLEEIAQEYNTTQDTLLALNEHYYLFCYYCSGYNVCHPKLNQTSGRCALLCNVKVQKACTLETPQLQVVIAQLAHTLVTITKRSSQPFPLSPLVQVISANNAQKLSLQGWSWSYLLISIHLVVLCSRLID
ncbi:hypothetical protein C3L33_19456, partial [Rhododendron williamsianum]